MRYLLIALLFLVAQSATAQKPTPKDCKEDPRRAGCQR